MQTPPQAGRSAPPALDSRLHGNDGRKFAAVSHLGRHPRKGTSPSRRNVIPAKERHPREGTSSPRRRGRGRGSILLPSPSRRRGSSDFAGPLQADRSAPPALDSRLHGNDALIPKAEIHIAAVILAKERHPREGGGPVTLQIPPQADRSAPQALDSRLHGNDGRKFAAVSHLGRHPRKGTSPSRRRGSSYS